MTRRLVIVVVVGITLAAIGALPANIAFGDVCLLIATSFGGALAVLVAVRAGISLIGTRRQALPLSTRTAIVALLPLVSLIIGAFVAASRMFVSVHDLWVLAVVLISAGTVGLLGALALATELDAALRDAAVAHERQLLVEQSRRELVAWVSHDLRTPLAGIRAMVEALDDGVVGDDESVHRYYATMIDEADRLSRLIEDLFELSRIQANALQLALERISLGDLVANAVNSAIILAQAKSICVDTVSVDRSVRVLGSAPEMTRVVRNLLDNAIRHTPTGGAVRVEVARESRHAVLSVVDQCGGIPGDDLDRVFDLAYRGDFARSSSEHDGAGLGLAIARGFIDAHDGEIRVSNNGDGCRFVVRLPLVHADAGQDGVAFDP